MIKSFFVILFSLMAWEGAAAPPVLQFAEKHHDLGSISQQGGTVECFYTFRNAGADPVVIRSAESSCSCTKAKFSKRPVLPGDTGRITVGYNPRNQQGAFNKAIRIYTTQGGSYLVTLKGEVVR